jgi:hypothetical protein
MTASQLPSLLTILAFVSSAACLEADEDAAPLEDPGLATQLISGGDPTPEPLPQPVEIVHPQGVFTVFPAARACFIELSANQSAGLAGYFAFQNFVKYPRVSVFWRRDDRATQSRIFVGDVIPDRFGFYSKVFNTTTNPSLFPGLFQFCLRNPGANPGPFQSDASVVTF